MARQVGKVNIVGTIDGICFYKMHDQYYARLKSSLTGKRFRTDKVFEGSRKSAERFATGNKVASKVYRMVEEEKRVYQLFCFLKKRAIRLGKEGRNEKEIKRILIELLQSFGLLGKKKKVCLEHDLGEPGDLVTSFQNILLFRDRFLFLNQSNLVNKTVHQFPQI